MIMADTKEVDIFRRLHRMLQPADLTNVETISQPERLYNALQRTQVQNVRKKPSPLIGQPMKFSGF